MADIPTIPPDLEAWLKRLVRLHEIHELFGVFPSTVKRWRWAAGIPEETWFSRLPPPVLLPEPLRRLFACSLWDTVTLLEWGRQTGRLDLNNKPQRLPPTGRPKAGA
jgi:hypothetical protein